MLPDGLHRELAKKTAKSIVDHGSIPMATLKESILLKDKVDELLAKEIEFPEQEPFPEIPEFPSEISITNLPDVQKVEVLNFPENQAPVVNISPQVVNVEAPVVNVNQEEVVDELVKIATLLSREEERQEVSGQTRIADQEGSIIDFKDLFKKLGEQIGSIRSGGSSVSKYLLNQLGVVVNPATQEGQDSIVTAIENITIPAAKGGATELMQDNIESTLNEILSSIRAIAHAKGVAADLRVTLLGGTTAVTGTLTAVTTLANQTNIGGIPAVQLVPSNQNIVSVLSNINNVTA